MNNTFKLFEPFLSRVSRSFRLWKRSESPESFSVIFDRFREVLERNNRSLEIITDMGEKLGGDYLFDVMYIRKAYGELREEIRGSILNFDLLTRNRYPELHAAYERIDTLIRRMVDGIPSMAREMVISFDNIDWHKFREVGGKNAHLSEVKNRLKLNVPEAFVITTDAFDAFIDHNGLRERIAQRPDAMIDETAMKALQESILQGEIPAVIDIALRDALEKIREKSGDCFLAVRSSAEEEDGGFSFAGQFETILNVHLDDVAVKDAYKKVVASLYSSKAMAYQRQLGYEIGRMRMAVGCVVMVDAVSSGVMYSTGPGGNEGYLLINATWGLGGSLVEGKIDGDLYVVRKESEPEMVNAAYGKKGSMMISLKEGGTTEVRTPDDMEMKPCLTGEQIAELAREGMIIEKYFGNPCDIEWAIGKSGTISILQARPLMIQGEGERPAIVDEDWADSGYALLFRNRGTVVQKGAGSGKVFAVKHPDELNSFPKGAVLVARHDSSLFVQVMPIASAIITEIGTPMSHMATLCREMKVPTVVNVGDAVLTLKQGQEVTLYAGDENTVAVYEGVARHLLARGQADSVMMEDVYEFRKKRYIMRYITPLNLVDPLMNEFTPEGCKSMHDILRFMHEKAVAELVESARRESIRSRGHGNVMKLDISVPAGIIVMDIGGGLDVHSDDTKATLEQIRSVPLRAIIRGMVHPGLWQSEAISLKVNDFLSSMMRMPDIVSDSEHYAGYNIAVISKEYVNLSIRFGYHFTMLDCYCSDSARNNHIYFRFVGGATDIVKRSRRVELIAAILREYGFNITTKGDLIVARLANIGRDETEALLDKVGRLIAYTRQLDALLHDDSAVTQYTRDFLSGHYEH